MTDDARRSVLWWQQYFMGT